tara:strand:+ start:6409 stop:7284 length:876 start_codon:yes stop_codon:yes gene_type:complete
MSDPLKYSFGVKALIFYNRDTFKPVGAFRVISSAEFAREIEQLPLVGGHHNGPWAIEAGEPTNTLTATLMQFPDFAFTELDNGVKTVNLGEETTGAIGTITAKQGTSLVSGTSGIASVSITATKSADLPLGKIVVVAASANTVDLYLLGDTASGSLPVTNELTLIQAGVVIADTSATIDVAGYGITITSGSGAIALNEGDTAFFTVRPANSKTTQIVMPDSSDIKILGCILVYPKNSQRQQKIVDFPKVAVAGTSFAANTREFAEFEMTATPLYDEEESALFTKTEIIASN